MDLLKKLGKYFIITLAILLVWGTERSVYESVG